MRYTVLSGSLACYNFSNWREDGGMPQGMPQATIAVLADRLEFAAPSFSLFFRPRTVPRTRVLRIRQLVYRHPLHRLILKVNPRGHGLQAVNLVVAHPPGEIYTGEIHYVLGTRKLSAKEVLEIFHEAGYPVDWEPRLMKMYSISAELSMDRFGST
jgi:hypothetical protein